MSFAAIALAGGGNRCYWQGGFLEALWAAHPFVPRLVVGVSGGAFQAAFTLAGAGERVRPLVDEACRTTPRNVEWARLLQTPLDLPGGRDVSGPAHRGFRRGGIGAPARRAGAADQDRPPAARLPVGLATAAGLLGYQLEKFATNRVHPRIGRRLGFRAEFVSTHRCETPPNWSRRLCASASVPPFMPVGRVAGAAALDGGLVDNVPVSPLAAFEAAGERTLVLATRRYKALPDVPNRVYVQPSQPIRVNKFDMTDGEGIRVAYRLGLADGAAFAASLRR